MSAVVTLMLTSLPVTGAWVSSTSLRCVQFRLNLSNQALGGVDTFSNGNDDGTDVAVSRQHEQRGNNVLDLRIPEPRLLAVDVISVAISVHLMAFADVMVDPLQFEPPNPSPLPMLMERDSILTVCWILSALTLNGYQQVTVASDIAVVKSTARMAMLFTVIRVALGVAVVFFTANNGLDEWDTLRQCYITAITVGALRFFYGQCNR